MILFGDEEGAAEAARALQIRHVPDVKRNEHGTKYLSPIFDGAQDLAHHSCLCYINCDIILLSDFRAAAERVLDLGGRFLMAGQRWDTDITAPVDFYAADWEATVRRQALEANHQRPPQWIDYFAFSRGLYYKNTPPFVIGRPGWDNWLVWHARHSGARVVDATAVVQAVHQNHDYSYHPDGEAGVWQGEEAQQNYALLQRRAMFCHHGKCDAPAYSRGFAPELPALGRASETQSHKAAQRDLVWPAEINEAGTPSVWPS